MVIVREIINVYKIFPKVMFSIFFSTFRNFITLNFISIDFFIMIEFYLFHFKVPLVDLLCF